MNDWQHVWRRIADGASRASATPPDGMPDGFAAKVLVEVDQRRRRVSARSENRLALVGSLVSTAAALTVAIWCWDAVQWYTGQWYTGATPVVLQDMIDLEPTP